MKKMKFTVTEKELDKLIPLIIHEGMHTPMFDLGANMDDTITLTGTPVEEKKEITAEELESWLYSYSSGIVAGNIEMAKEMFLATINGHINRHD